MILITKMIGTGLATTGSKLKMFVVAYGLINPSGETILIIIRYLSMFIILFLGFLIVIYLILFFIFLIYTILYYLISKIDWIKNKREKEFTLINKKKFLLYIIKFLFMIIFVGFFSFIIKYLTNLAYIGPIEYNNYYYIFNTHMFFYWLAFIVIFYIYIYFFSLKNLNTKDYVLLFFYRFFVFFILRIILYVLCPEEYTIYLSQGLISIFLFPDFILNILNKILGSFQFLVYLSPIVSEAEAEGSNLKDYLEEKYQEHDPRRDPKNYPRIKDWKGIPPLSRKTLYAIEETFYRPPANPDPLSEEFTLVIARKAHKKPRIYTMKLRDIWFMCSGGEEPWVIMPVFTKAPGPPVFPVGEYQVAVSYENGNIQVYNSVGYRYVNNYEISDAIYTIKASGSGARENYNPLYLWHLNKKMYVNDINGRGFLIGNSRGRIFENEYLIQEFQQEFLRDKYNVKCFTD